MRRRGNGEGSIYRDTAGRWRGYVDLGYSGGRRRRKYVIGRTRREVAAKLREASTARDAGTLVVTDSTQTVGDWLEFWLESIAAKPRSAPPRCTPIGATSGTGSFRPWDITGWTGCSRSTSRRSTGRASRKASPRPPCCRCTGSCPGR